VDDFEDADDATAAAAALAEQYAVEVSPDTAWLAEQLLALKAVHIDGSLTRWGPGELDEVLLEVLPRKVVFEPGDEARVVPTAVALLGWLGRTGRLTGPYSADALVEHVVSRAGAVAEALRDPSRWGPAKRMVQSMADSGVDLSDPAQLEQAMAAFNARPFGERDAVLGPLPSGLGPALFGDLPPVVLAPDGELDDAARNGVWWQRVRTLCAWVGSGRTLTDNGNLRLADGKELIDLLGTDDRFDEQIGEQTFKTKSTTELRGVDFTLVLGLEAGYLEVDGTRLRAGPDVAHLEEEPREASYRLFVALMRSIGPLAHHFGEDTYGLGWYADEVDRGLMLVLVDLYRAPGTLTADDIAGGLWTDAQGLLDDNEVEAAKRVQLRSGFDFGVGLGLQRLRELGLVTDDAGMLSLTPLGTWSVQRLLSQTVDAPVVGRLADLPVAELLSRAGDLAEPVAAAELDHWVARHGAAALLEGLRAAGPTGRGLAFRALLRVGPVAGDAVALLDGDLDLAPYAEVWRVDAVQAVPAPATDAEHLVRVLGAVVDVWGPQSVAHWTGLLTAGPVPLVETAWRVRLPQTEPVLAALGAVPDKMLAKTARRALFKHRSTGG
jgi:hypothetical protein